MRVCRCGSAGVRLRGVDSGGGGPGLRKQPLFDSDKVCFSLTLRFTSELCLCVCVCVINKFALFD